MGDGGELERALDDAFSTGVTVRSCCEKRFEKNLCKSRQNSPTVAKVFKNEFGQVVEKPCQLLFVFVWFRESKEI